MLRPNLLPCQGDAERGPATARARSVLMAAAGPAHAQFFGTATTARAASCSAASMATKNTWRAPRQAGDRLVHPRPVIASAAAAPAGRDQQWLAALAPRGR